LDGSGGKSIADNQALNTESPRTRRRQEIFPGAINKLTAPTAVDFIHRVSFLFYSPV
jgi:hypothetical protein